MRTFFFKVAGVTYDGRQALIAQLRGDEPVRAVQEPSNPYDPNAIAIHVAHDGQVWHCGFMPRDKAKEYAPLLEGENLDGHIREITGGFELSDGSTAAYGLIVTFELPEERDQYNDSEEDELATLDGGKYSD